MGSLGPIPLHRFQMSGGKMILRGYGISGPFVLTTALRRYFAPALTDFTGLSR